jgi:5S rRNA maturation endonuclease (ribonuclease M5)
VIVLTDFDREGVFLAKRLARILNSQKIHANLVLWRELRGLTRSHVRSIEELPKFYQRLQTEARFRVPPIYGGYGAMFVTKPKRERSKFQSRL